MAPFGIRVILIEPGPIRTEFSATVHRSSDELLAGADAAPYAAMIERANAARAQSKRRGGLGPEAVAHTIARALAARHPAARYPVTALAHVAVRARSLLPDRVFDRSLRATMTG